MNVTRNDRGAVDVSVQMLFGMIALLFTLLLVVESSAHWHPRNVFDDAASEGARVAAAFDGTCPMGIAAARRSITAHGGGWARGAVVTCTTGPTVSVTVEGRTPGVVAPLLGMRVRVTEQAPKEG
jgi:hypothetical protein